MSNETDPPVIVADVHNHINMTSSGYNSRKRKVHVDQLHKRTSFCKELAMTLVPYTCQDGISDNNSGHSPRLT